MNIENMIEIRKGQIQNAPQKGQIVMNPEYPQCYCNALLNFSGHQKYKEAQDKLYRILNGMSKENLEQ